VSAVIVSQRTKVLSWFGYFSRVPKRCMRVNRCVETD